MVKEVTALFPFPIELKFENVLKYITYLFFIVFNKYNEQK